VSYTCTCTYVLLGSTYAVFLTRKKTKKRVCRNMEEEVEVDEGPQEPASGVSSSRDFEVTSRSRFRLSLWTRDYPF
jgi:hypothetical protein